jgi:deoxyribonuclease (pyrimidine dimer)
VVPEVDTESMTRVNIVPVTELSREHLVAEYREIARIPGALKKSLERRKPFTEAEIPTTYTLGPGHVKFFYNKLQFLHKRYAALVAEMQQRGYRPQHTDTTRFCPPEPKLEAFYRDWAPTSAEVAINRARLQERTRSVSRSISRSV